MVFGGVRPNVPTPSGPSTDLGYTGQRNLDADIGLMDYKARFYSTYLNRFVQPDTLIPDLANPQAWNRYSYVANRPINFNDPTGHCFGPLAIICVALIEAAPLIAEMATYAATAYIAADTMTRTSTATNSEEPYLVLDVIFYPGSPLLAPPNPTGLTLRNPEKTFLIRGGDRSPSNPKFWYLRDRDVVDTDTAGLSVFKNPPVTSNYLLNKNSQTSSWWNKTAEVDITKLPKNLEVKNTSTNGFFNDSVLDENHFVIRDPARLASMPSKDYLNWWNNDMADRLAKMFGMK